MPQPKLIPLANVEEIGLGVTRRTLGRYIKEPPPGFPHVIKVNGRLYFLDVELAAFKETLIQSAMTSGRRVLGRDVVGVRKPEKAA